MSKAVFPRLGVMGIMTGGRERSIVSDSGTDPLGKAGQPASPQVALSYRNLCRSDAVARLPAPPSLWRTPDQRVGGQMRETGGIGYTVLAAPVVLVYGQFDDRGHDV